jgi:hypothetical protein
MTEDRSLPYRCLVHNDDRSARLKIGVRNVDCELVDLSREDFHVRLPQHQMKLLRPEKRMELLYGGERWLVACCGNRHPMADTVYLNRIEELTPVRMPSAWRGLASAKLSQQTDPRFILTLMLAFIFSCIALPGLGDQIGTAPKVKKGIHSVIEAIKGANK